MSFGKALYFPYIHFRDEEWLKHALLYWDCIKRIVPRSYQAHDSNDVRMLADAGAIQSVDPLSGKTPYAVGAANEFIPVMNSLMEKRGNLHRGAQVTNRVKRNAPEVLVHVQKMDERVIRLLVTSELADRCGDWFAMDGALAGYYMLCLAAHIGEKQRTPLLSDSYEMETGGTFFQYSRSLVDLNEQRDVDTGFHLAKMVMPIPHPRQLNTVSIRKLLKFRDKYESERMQFRRSIEEIAKSAASLDDPDAVKDFFEEKKKTIENEITGQEKRLDDLGVDTAFSLTCISVPTVFVAATKLFTNPVSVAIMAGAGLAYSVVNLYSKRRVKKRKAIRNCDWHYLLTLRRKFSVRKVAKDSKMWMDQFVYD